MQQVTTVVAPVFALIAIGYLAGRLRYLSDVGTKGLAEFTFNIAIPALLFRKMATAEMPAAHPYALWGAYYGTALIIWVVSAALAVAVLRRTRAEAVSISMSAAFSNVVMIGMPLCLTLYGEAAAAPVAILVSLHTPLLWMAAAIHLGLARSAGSVSLIDIAKGLAHELARNAIIIAVLAGSLWRLTGLGLAPLPDQIISILGQAGIPCALISLGLSLVGFRIAGQVPTLTTILVLKLIMMPLVAWLMARGVFGLPPVAAGVVTVFAAMPTGANAYLFATRNNLAQHSASGAVALGTVIAAVTASVVILLLTG